MEEKNAEISRLEREVQALRVRGIQERIYLAIHE